MVTNSHFRPSFWFALAALFWAPQILRAAVTLTVNPTSVNLPSPNAGSTAVVSYANPLALSATGSGTATFTTSPPAYGTAPVAYTSRQNWLTVSTSTTTITANGASVPIALTGNPTGLQAGTYTATVTFTAGASSATLTVTFTPQGADLTAGLKAPLSPLAAGQKAQVGEIDVALTNSNGSATTQTIQVSTRTDGGNWLLTSADSPLSVTGPGAITVTVDATNLAGGSTHTATITVGCVNGAPCLPQSIPVSVQVTAAAPALTAINPNSGSVGATVAVTLTGSNLTGATAINAGSGITVNGVSVVSATQITAIFLVAANAATGTRNVTVTTPAGTSNAVTFTIIPPITLTAHTGITLSQGAGSTAVIPDSSACLTATGSGTVTLTTSPVVYVSYPTLYSTPPKWLTIVSAPASVSAPTSTACDTSTQIGIQVSFAGLQAWNYTATVTFTAGTSTATLQISISVTGSDLTAGLRNVTSPVQAGANKPAVVNVLTATVTASVINGPLVPNTQVQTMSTPSTWLSTDAEYPNASTLVSGTGSINVNVNPANLMTPGTYQGSIIISCINQTCLQQQVSVSVQVTAAAPTLTSISPNSGSVGATVTVTLTGSNLSGATSINAGPGITVNGINVASATQITANFAIAANASSGAQNVTVTTPAGTSNAVPFTINPPAAPTLNSINPNTGQLGATVTVTLTGSNLSGATAINAGPGVTINGINVASATQITANFAIAASAATGAQNVTVTTPAGTSNAVPFTINPPLTPTLSSINPNTGQLGATVTVTLTGNNLSGATAVNAGPGVTINGINVASATQITANFAIAVNASTGSQNVTVTTPAGTSNAVTFTINPPTAPTLNSINPNSGQLGATVTVTLTGSNLIGVTAINAGSGITVNGINVPSATQITATFAIAASTTTGVQNVTVTTPGGTSNALTFNITAPPAPTLSSINPNSGQLGATVPVTLSGTNLTGATAINAGLGIMVSGLTAVNSGLIDATFSISASASTGNRNVTVVTPGGTSNSVAFTIALSPGPVLNSIAPISGTVGTTVPVTLSGSNLGGATAINAGAGIAIGGLNVLGDTQLIANFVIAPGAAAGNYPVTVTTPNGTSNAVPFAVTAATSLTSVLPHIAAGASFVTGFFVVNSGSSSASFSITFRRDDGSSMGLPFSNGETLSTLSGTIPANGLGYYEAGDPNDATLLSGSGTITSDPSITIQAIFRRQTSNVYYEAAVPSSAGSKEFEIPFDATTFAANGAQILTGFAVANMDSGNSANVTCTARDSQGNVIPNGVPVQSLSPYGHWAGYMFPPLVGDQGTIDCTSNTEIGAVALRALGPAAISSLPVVIKGSSTSPVTAVLPHIATGQSFVTGFYVLNSGSSSANFSISFRHDDGSSMALPFSNGQTLGTLSDTIPANGLRYYEAGDPNSDLLSGSGLVTSDPSITIQALFRRQVSNVYYEAAVPASTGNYEFEIPFDATTFAGNGAQIYTGFAIANMDSANSANVTCTARDSQGNVIPNAVIVQSLSPYGHWAGYMFPALAGLRGTLDCSSNTKLGTVALRALGPDAISSLPVIAIR